MPLQRGSEFRDGSYRMIFSDKKNASAHHNKLNIRDTSTEPSNLFGDRNLYNENNNNNDDLNDREQDSDDGPPPLETAYVSPDQRRRMNMAKKRKPDIDIRLSREGLRRTGNATLKKTPAKVTTSKVSNIPEEEKKQEPPYEEAKSAYFATA